MNAGVVVMAQMPVKGPRVTAAFKADPELLKRVQEVVDEEQRRRKDGDEEVTQSKATEFLVALGLDIYWARHDLGQDLLAQLHLHAIDLARAAGSAEPDTRAALTDVLRRGLASVATPLAKPAKKGGR